MDEVGCYFCDALAVRGHDTCQACQAVLEGYEGDDALDPDEDEDPPALSGAEWIAVGAVTLLASVALMLAVTVLLGVPA